MFNFIKRLFTSSAKASKKDLSCFLSLSYAYPDVTAKLPETPDADALKRVSKMRGVHYKNRKERNLYRDNNDNFMFLYAGNDFFDAFSPLGYYFLGSILSPSQGCSSYYNNFQPFEPILNNNGMFNEKPEGISAPPNPGMYFNPDGSIVENETNSSHTEIESPRGNEGSHIVSTM